MDAPPISLGRVKRRVAPPAIGGSQDRLWTSGDLSDIAAQLVGVFGIYPRSLAWSSRFCDLPALCRRYRFRPLKMINLRLHARGASGRQPSDRLAAAARDRPHLALVARLETRAAESALHPGE